MIIKDLIRKVNKLNKKHPEARVFFLTESSEVGFISTERVVLAYAPVQQIEQNEIKEDDCIKDPQEGYGPIIVLG